jgi:predicted MPP superfamily phosphohydrolase
MRDYPVDDKHDTVRRMPEHDQEATEVFSWVHLSDIHLLQPPATTKAEQALILDALCTDLQDQLSDGRRASAILISGDVAFSGGSISEDEYKSATALIKRLQQIVGVQRDAVFVVPGNHDVDLGDGKKQEPHLKRLLSDLRGGESIDEVLANETELRLLLTRQRAYDDFSAFYAPACRRSGEKLAASWMFRFAIGGIIVRLIGLNTSLLTAKDDDQGKLQIGVVQLAQCFVEPPIADNELVISMSHHPLSGGWLRDEKRAGQWIRKHSRVHLSGHAHEQDASQTVRSYGSFVSVCAGAVHDSFDKHAMGYSFGTITRRGESVSVRVWPRAWSEKSYRFISDGEVCDEGEISVEFPLGKITTKPLAPDVPLLNPYAQGGRSSHHPIVWEDLQIDEVKQLLESRLDTQIEVCARSDSNVAVVFRLGILKDFAEMKTTALGCAIILSETKRQTISVSFYNTGAVSRDDLKAQATFVSFQFATKEVQSVAVSKIAGSSFWRTVGLKWCIDNDTCDRQINLSVTEFENLEKTSV